MFPQLTLTRHRHQILLLIAIVAMFVAPSAMLHADHEVSTRRILVLHEIADATPGRMTFSSEFFRLMRENTDYNISVTFEFLGLNLLDENEAPTQAIESLEYITETQSIDVVLSLLPDAGDFLLTYGDELFPDIPKVFVLPQVSNVEAIAQLPQSAIVESSANKAIDKTVTDIFTILPETQRLIVFSGATDTDLSYLNRAQEIIPNIVSDDVRVEYLVGIPYTELEHTLINQPQNTAVLALLYERDTEGNIYQFSEVTHNLSLVSPAPIFSILELGVVEGVVGGTVGTMELYAQSAAEIVFDILNHSDTDTYHLIAEGETRTVYDAQALKHWGISPDRLPEGSVIINAEDNFLEEHLGLVVSGVVVIVLESVLIIALIWSRRRRIRAESSLKTSEQRFRAIFDNASDAIGVSSHGKHVFVNNMYREIFGIHADFDLVGTPILDYIAPSEHDRILAYVRSRTTDNLAPTYYETRGKRVDNGHEFDMEVRLSTLPMDDQVYSVVFLRDISERKRSDDLLQARLHLSEYAVTHGVDEFLQKTLDEAELLTDSSIGFYHFLNEDLNTIELTAWSSNTLANLCELPQKKYRHYPIEQAGIWADAVRLQENIIHNDINAVENKRHFPEGHAPVNREIVVTVKRSNQIVAIVGVGNKPTEYTEEDANMLYQVANMSWDIVSGLRAQVSLKQSEELVALKDQFITMISHEFRTPMAVIQTSSDMLTNYYDRMSEERKRQLVTQISEQVRHMTEMVTNTLTMSKSQRGIIELSPALLDVEAFCQKMLNQVKISDMVGHNYHFEIHLQDQQVVLDSNLLEHILLNLLLNASKYTPQDGDISLIVNDDDQHLTLIVKDNGIGIPEDARASLFDSFYRAHNVGNVQGSGLGLAIVRHFVALHYGKIDIESQVDVGSTFTIMLPKNLEPA